MTSKMLKLRTRDVTIEQIKSTLMASDWYARKVGCAPSLSLDHYESVGWKEGLDPHIFFDTQYVLDRFAGGNSSGSPFEVFHSARRHGVVASTPFFNAAWYVKGNPDVVTAQFDPFLHYVIHGAAEGRQANPFYRLTPADFSPGEVCDFYQSIDDFIEQCDELRLVTADWLHEALSVERDVAHKTFWRGRGLGSRDCRWPLNPELLLGPIIVQSFPQLQELRSALEGVCNDVP